MRAVVKLGGALFRREPNVTSLKGMGRALGGFVEDGNQLVLVAGGGENARTYIATARKLGGDESTCDLLGIQITRANAELVRLAIGAMAGEVFAGRYELLDPLAIKIMQRARIPTRFVSLGDPGNIIAALQGKDIGTKVVYS